MKSISIICAALLLTAPAFAQTTKAKTKRTPAQASSSTITHTGATPVLAGSNASLSTLNYHPTAGKQSLTATPNYGTTDYTLKFKSIGAKDNRTETATLVNLRYDRGLANNWAGSIEAGLGEKKETTSRVRSATNVDSGITDIKATARHIRTISVGQAFYGGSLTISPSEKQESFDDGQGNRSSGNLYSGGNILAPFFGVQRDYVQYVVGAMGTYQLKMDRSTTTAAGGHRSSGTISDGNVTTATAFAEMPKNQYLLGAKASFEMTASQEQVGNTNGARYKETTDAYNALYLGVYGKYSATPRVDVIPTLTYGKLLDASGGSTSLDSAEAWNLTIDARIAL